MAKPNYRHAKKQKEAARKARQDAKQQRRAGSPGQPQESVEQAVLRVVDLRVRGNFRQVAAQQRQVMPFVHPAHEADALNRGLVADMAAQRVAGIGRIDHDAALADDLAGLPDEPRLRIARMHGEALRHAARIQSCQTGVQSSGRAGSRPASKRLSPSA